MKKFTAGEYVEDLATGTVYRVRRSTHRRVEAVEVEGLLDLRGRGPRDRPGARPRRFRPADLKHWNAS